MHLLHYCNSIFGGQLLHIAIFNSFFGQYCYCNSSGRYCQLPGLTLYLHFDFWKTFFQNFPPYRMDFSNFEENPGPQSTLCDRNFYLFFLLQADMYLYQKVRISSIKNEEENAWHQKKRHFSTIHIPHPDGTPCSMYTKCLCANTTTYVVYEITRVLWYYNMRLLRPPKLVL